MDTLNRCQGHAEWGRLRRKQPSSCISFHNGNAHSLLLADPVQFRSLRIDATQALLVILCKICIQILAGREKVKGRINTEQEHFNLSA